LTRQQLSDTYNNAKKNSATDQSNAQQSFANANNSVSNFSKSLRDYMQGANQTYGEGGDYMKDQNTLANTTAAAGSNAVGTDLAMNRMRTGENTAGYGTTLAESRRTASRDLTNQLATADAARLDKLNQTKQFGVDASKFPAQVQEAMYGTSLNGANSSLGTAEQAAAANTGFGDMLANGVMQLGTGFARGAGASMFRQPAAAPSSGGGDEDEGA